MHDNIVCRESCVQYIVCGKVGIYYESGIGKKNRIFAKNK